MSPRADVSAERRNQILDTAAAIFARYGFHQARMDDIVQASGLSKGAIYWYFKSKDEIIIALLQRFFGQELAGAQALLDDPNPVGERLLQISRQIIADTLHVTTIGLIPLFYEFYAMAQREGQVREFIRTYFFAYRDLLSTLIRQGIARGEFRPIDAEQAATTLCALYEGTLLIWGVVPEGIDLEQQVLAAVRLLIAGISA